MQDFNSYLVESMKDCSRKSIDDEKNSLVCLAMELISKFQSGLRNQELKELAIVLKQDIYLFRMKLACDKGTEFLEGILNWTAGFDDLTKQLELIANSIKIS